MAAVWDWSGRKLVRTRSFPPAAGGTVFPHPASEDATSMDRKFLLFMMRQNGWWGRDVAGEAAA